MQGALIQPAQFSRKAEKNNSPKILINCPVDAVEKLIKTAVGKVLHYFYVCNCRIKSSDTSVLQIHFLYLSWWKQWMEVAFKTVQHWNILYSQVKKQLREWRKAEVTLNEIPEKKCAKCSKTCKWLELEETIVEWQRSSGVFFYKAVDSTSGTEMGWKAPWTECWFQRQS